MVQGGVLGLSFLVPPLLDLCSLETEKGNFLPLPSLGCTDLLQQLQKPHSSRGGRPRFRCPQNAVTLLLLVQRCKQLGALAHLCCEFSSIFPTPQPFLKQTAQIYMYF